MLPGKTLTPIDILQMARRRAWLIVIPPVLTLFVALLYSSRVTDLYQSDMLIAVDPQRVPDDYVRSTVTLGADRRVSAIAVQVTSRTNLQKMIEKHGLYASQRRHLTMDDVVAIMTNNISVAMEPAPGSERPAAFHVRFTYSDPEVAAAVTQELGSLFVQQNTRDRGNLAEATNTFLETQLAEARQRLESQERKLELFRRQHGQSMPTQMGANLQALQTKQLQVQSLVESLVRDRDRKEMLERLYRQALNETPTVLPQAASSGAFSPPAATETVAQQLAAARAQLAALERRYTGDHPDVGRARRLIADLEPKAAAEAAALAQSESKTDPALTTVDPVRRERLRQIATEIEGIEREMKLKEATEQRLRGEIAEYQTRVEAVPGLESEWVALTRDYDTQQAAYKELLSKSGNAKVAAALEEQQIGEHFRIVDPARVPVHPLPSVRAKINVAGMAFGLLFGLGLAALLELRDASFRTEKEVMELMALPVLAAIPRIETAGERTRRRRHIALATVAGFVCLVGMGYVTWTEQLWKSLR